MLLAAMYAPRKNLDFLQHAFSCEVQPPKNLEKYICAQFAQKTAQFWRKNAQIRGNPYYNLQTAACSAGSAGSQARPADFQPGLLMSC